MGRTTIQIPEELKEALKEERRITESSYADTLWRLLEKETVETEQRLREIIREETTDS